MGQTSVYNSGSFEEKDQNTETMEFGLFFDGTANNLYNTDARKYMDYEKKFHNKTLSERGKKEMHRIWKEYPEKGYAPHKYTREMLRKAYEKYKNNTSYGNDHTNVARMYLNANRIEYAIYIEGVGTGDLLKDNDLPGISHADGEKGLLKKIKKGSEDLAKEIRKRYDIKNRQNVKIENIILTLDVFGFSRGATAARHFLYQVSNNKHLEVKVVSQSVRNTFSTKTILTNVDESYLRIALKEVGLNELVKKINIRFVGLYDTVVSFNPIRYDIDTDFEKYVHLLHLNEIGDPMLAIHFTALDEFRKHFSLTRLVHPKAIEKNLPGAHSDVGGSYDCDQVHSEKVILGQNLTHLEELDNLKQQLIKEGWYSKEELELLDNWFDQNELIGTRNLKGEYSYLPLLWMSKYASFLIEDEYILFKQIEDLYKIEDDILKEVKKHLDETTFKELPQTLEGIKSNEEIKNFIQKDNEVKEDWTFQSEVKQELLKKLRHKYLHQSAHYGSSGPFIEPHKPNEDRKRREFPA